MWFGRNIQIKFSFDEDFTFFLPNSNNPNGKSNRKKNTSCETKTNSMTILLYNNKKFKHEGRCAETFLYHGKHIDEYLDYIYAASVVLSNKFIFCTIFYQWL